jgi:hypothetical protein
VLSFHIHYRTLTHSPAGTAIWVFNIVPNTLPGTDTIVNATFSLDGGPSETYFHNPDSSSTYIYNVPVYSNQNLKNIEHNLLITPNAGTHNSVFVFDYAIYTYVPIISKSTLSHTCFRFDDTPTSSSSQTTPSSTPTSSESPSTNTPSPNGQHKSSTPVGAIAGGVVGGLAALALALLALFCYRRRGHGGGVDRIMHEDKAVLDSEDALATPQPLFTANMHNPSVHLPEPSSGPFPMPAFRPSSDASQLTPSPATPNSAPGPRAAKLLMRQAELQRQLDAARAAMHVRNPSESVSSSGGRPSLYPPSSFSAPDGPSSEERALQERVQALEAEVNRLRAESVAPPAYEGGQAPSGS